MSASVTSPVSDMLSEGSVAHSIMSDSSQRHGLQFTRLLCPWDSPGENTGVGCHFSPPENLPDPGIKPASLVSPVLSSRFCTTSLPGKPMSDRIVGKQRLNYVQFNMYRGLVKDYWKNGSELNHFSREKLFYSYKVQWVLVMSVLVIGQGDICSGMKFGILA